MRRCRKYATTRPEIGCAAFSLPGRTGGGAPSAYFDHPALPLLENGPQQSVADCRGDCSSLPMIPAILTIERFWWSRRRPYSQRAEDSPLDATTFNAPTPVGTHRSVAPPHVLCRELGLSIADRRYAGSQSQKKLSELGWAGLKDRQGRRTPDLQEKKKKGRRSAL
jgi:hypothetical protein